VAARWALSTNFPTNAAGNLWSDLASARIALPLNLTYARMVISIRLPQCLWAAWHDVLSAQHLRTCTDHAELNSSVRENGTTSWLLCNWSSCEFKHSVAIVRRRSGTDKCEEAGERLQRSSKHFCWRLPTGLHSRCGGASPVSQHRKLHRVVPTAVRGTRYTASMDSDFRSDPMETQKAKASPRRRGMLTSRPLIDGPPFVKDRLVTALEP